MKVERDGNYDMKILLYDNGSIRDSGSVGIKGLNALIPVAKLSRVIINNIDFVITGASAGRVSVRTDAYLENTGSSPSENLNMVIKARHAESNILADKGSSETDIIPAEVTVVKSVQLNIPEGYNYMMAVELWRGDVLLNTWEKALMLAPAKTVPRESVEKKMNIEVSEFVRENGAPPAPAGVKADEAGYVPQVKAEPGFELMAVIAAIMMVIGLRRKS